MNCNKCLNDLYTIVYDTAKKAGFNEQTLGNITRLYSKPPESVYQHCIYIKDLLDLKMAYDKALGDRYENTI